MDGKIVRFSFPFEENPIYKPKERKRIVEATIELVDYGIQNLRFDDYFFKSGDLWTFTEDKKPKNFDEYWEWFKTDVTIHDKNRGICYNVHTSMCYNHENHYEKDGKPELFMIHTMIGNGMQVNPSRHFDFWLAVSKALRNNEEIPKIIRRNLDEIKDLTLNDYFSHLRKDRKKDDFFVRNYDGLGWTIKKEYHPVSLDQ